MNTNSLKKIATEIKSKAKIDFGDIADFLGQVEHIFESIEEGKNTGSGEDPISIIKKNQYSKSAKEIRKQIYELMRRNEEKFDTKYEIMSP